jgi:hypothetical protein
MHGSATSIPGGIYVEAGRDGTYLVLSPFEEKGSCFSVISCARPKKQKHSTEAIEKLGW